MPDIPRLAPRPRSGTELELAEQGGNYLQVVDELLADFLELFWDDFVDVGYELTLTVSVYENAPGREAATYEVFGKVTRNPRWGRAANDIDKGIRDLITALRFCILAKDSALAIPKRNKNVH